MKKSNKTLLYMIGFMLIYGIIMTVLLVRNNYNNIPAIVYNDVSMIEEEKTIDN